MYKSCPQTLLPVLPSLEGELRVEDVSRRLAAVELLGHLFGQRGLDIDVAYSQLFSEFVRRFRDIKARSRACLHRIQRRTYEQPSDMHSEKSSTTQQTIIRRDIGGLVDGHEGASRVPAPP